MRLFSFLLFALFLITPARADVIDDAVNNAIAAFERASPTLGATQFGVDTQAYRDALVLGRFSSSHWAEPLALNLVRSAGGGNCTRFAAYVTLPPQQGTVTLTLCPQFVDSGTPALRTLTILHEMVHVVAGPDECRAMAFAAQIEQLSTGTTTPVDRYWQANSCASSGYQLP